MAELGNDIEQNVELFIEQAVSTGLVWGLVADDIWAVCSAIDDDNVTVYPFWSNEAAAKIHCQDDWANYEPRPLDTDDFIDNWLPGMQKAGELVGPNWNAELEGEEMEPLDLAEALIEHD